VGTETDIPNLFVVETPLGFTVRVTEHYWRAIVAKHPDLAGRQEEIQATLREPEEVRRSRRDPAVLLFYRAQRPRDRWAVAVAKRENREGFLITADPSRSRGAGATRLLYCPGALPS